MWISKVNIQDIRGFAEPTLIKLDKKMNLLVGRNNAGKSTILKLIFLLQKGDALNAYVDVRINSDMARAFIKIHDVPKTQANPVLNFSAHVTEAVINFDFNRINNTIEKTHNVNNQNQVLNHFRAEEPDNLIYPFLSKRKVINYDQSVNKGIAFSVPENLSNLPARVDLLTSSNYPLKKEFDSACRDILGFEVSAFPAESGKKAGFFVNEFNNVSIEAMGDGVPHLLGLIASLCMAKDKIFLIEEPENDIHPQALKSLLELIIKKSNKNQFVISTHSNIVTKYLGAIPDAKIHHFSSISNSENIPTTEYKVIGNMPDEKREVLIELGYELSDYDLWDGWLFLEEATAEKIIREFLIPSFTKKSNNKIKTLSSKGAQEAKNLFDEFYRLFLFTHLTPMYINKAWVVLDGEKTAIQAIEKLKTKYTGEGKAWHEENFRNLSKKNFEEYYPQRFAEKVNAVLALPHGKNKQDAKKKLLDEVLQWINSNKDEAIKEFKISAKEVIDILSEIEKRIAG